MMFKKIKSRLDAVNEAEKLAPMMLPKDYDGEILANTSPIGEIHVLRDIEQSPDIHGDALNIIRKIIKLCKLKPYYSFSPNRMFSLVDWKLANSPEGFVIGLEFSEEAQRNALVINLWLYDEITLLQRKELHLTIYRLLQIFPEAAIVFEDDSFDYNPNGLDYKFPSTTGLTTGQAKNWDQFYQKLYCDYLDEVV